MQARQRNLLGNSEEVLLHGRLEGYLAGTHGHEEGWFIGVSEAD